MKGPGDGVEEAARASRAVRLLALARHHLIGLLRLVRATGVAMMPISHQRAIKTI